MKLAIGTNNYYDARSKKTIVIFLESFDIVDWHPYGRSGKKKCQKSLILAFEVIMHIEFIALFFHL